MLTDLTEAGLDVTVVNVPVHARKVVRRILPARYLESRVPPK
jgi:hypothetical protein